MTMMLLLAPGAFAADVLMLGDGGTEVPAQATLRQAGHTVDYIGEYDDWDPLTHPVEDYEVVVWFQGESYSRALDDDQDESMVDYVRQGGVLVRTEWAAYAEGDAQIDAMLPVNGTGDYDYDGSTWSVGDPGHPVASSVPEGRYVFGAHSATVAKNDAHVVFWNDAGHAMWTELVDGVGLQIHINHAGVDHQDNDIDDFLVLLEATVSYAGDVSLQGGGTGSAPGTTPGTSGGTEPGAPGGPAGEGAEDGEDGEEALTCSSVGSAGAGSALWLLGVLGLRRRS